jgi:hypothetical protein
VLPRRSAPRPAYDCGPCYKPETRARFWGFATIYVDASAVADVSDTGSNTRLSRLEKIGYSYRLTAPQPDGPSATLAMSEAAPIDPVLVTVSMPSEEALWWRLEIAPSRGWAPVWRDPALGAVAVLSAAIGALSCGILVSRRRLKRTVKALTVGSGFRLGVTSGG